MNRLNLSDARHYILSGKAVVTFQNIQPKKASESQFTYLVRAKITKSGEVSVWRVYNCGDYLGTICDDQFHPTTYDRTMILRPKALQVFTWVWKRIITQQLPDTVHILHRGYCGRCGRTLTDADSIRTGIGPECRKKMGLQLKLDYAHS